MELISTSYRGNIIRTTPMHLHQIKLSLLLALFSILAVMVSMPLKSQASIIYPNTTLTPSSSSVWTSPNGNFSMGFFSFLPSTYYVGIWYALLPLNQSIIWTANREQSVPVNSTLQFTHDGRLQLTTPSSNSSNSNLIIWETSSLSYPITNASQAELLDSGNFVLRDTTSKILWQSFDHPTDTLLPAQNFTFSPNASLVPWISITDPSPSSKYSLVFGRTAGPLGHIRLLYQNTDEYWSAPPPEVITALSNTTINIDATGTISLYNGDGNLVWDNSNSICPYAIDSLTKLQLSVDGNLRVLTWSSRTWDTQWRALYLQCDVFGTCGDNGICDKNQNNVSVGGGGCPSPEAQLENTLCSCPQGFTRNGSNCTPPSSLNCSQSMSKMEHTSFGVPGATADYSPLTQAACESTRCLDECNCTAASYSNSSSGCWLYDTSLFNGMRYAQIDKTSFIKTIDTSFNSDGSNLPAYAIALIVVAISLILLLISAGLFIRHQIRSRHPSFKQVLLDPDVLDKLGGPKRFSFEDLYMVTRGFHEENKLGAGGFGSVYKGTFTTPHGNLDVAIKRLDKSQRQGFENKDFLAEIETLGSIKHVNVVNLMGFCAEGVYEYVANGSLNNHILNESSILSWDARFQIAVGAATGIEYLHAHCPKKIVHRDIKPDNILIDEEFKAKVADFGISQIMGPERTHLTNNTVRGTPTYMAPECWQVGSLITEKADAYSYGLVLLELVSGRRVTKEHYVEDQEEGGGGEQDNTSDQEQKNVRRKRRMLPLEHAVNEMERGRWERLEGVYKREDAERLVKIAFWCLQGNPEQRPSMEDLVLMIKGHKAVAQAPLLGLFHTAGASNHFNDSSQESSSIAAPEQYLSQGR